MTRSIALLATLLPSIEAQLEYVNVFTAVSDVDATSNDAEYDCRVTNLWTEGRHPADFPSDDPHWSPPIVVSHRSSFSIFDEGADHTDGLELLAESGGVSTIQDEIETAISDGDAKYFDFVGGFDGGSLKFNTRFRGIQMDNSNRYLSMATMIAPSPDWFSGFNNFEMRDSSTRNWFQEVILDCFPWDAGSDSGDTYEAANSNSAGTVFQLTTDTIPDTQVFLSPEGSTVLPVMRVECTLDGNRANKCKKRIFQNCRRNSQCCEGLSCQDVGRKRNKCYPLLYETQACVKNRDCFGDLSCSGGFCA